jgi:hypothetical protein
MKKTLVIILALAMALTMVMGSASTVSAKGKPGTIHVTSVDLYFYGDQETSIADATLDLAVGNSFDFIAKLTPSDATNQKVSWTSSDRKAVDLVRNGLQSTVTGSTVGATTIIQVKTADGKLTASCTVNVVEGILLEGMDPITGTPRVGQELTAGAVTPSTGEVAYAWYRSFPAQGGVGWSAIPGATADTYTVTASDVGHYLEVLAIGYGSHIGEVKAQTDIRIPGADPNVSPGVTQYFNEDFSYCYTYDVFPYKWTVGGSDPEEVFIGTITNWAGGVTPELTYSGLIEGPIDAYIVTPPIDITGAAHLNVAFRTYLYWSASRTGTFTWEVDASSDGTNWTVVSSSSPTGQQGPSRTGGSIPDSVWSGKDTIQLRFYVHGTNYQTQWYIDDVTLFENVS